MQASSECLGDIGRHKRCCPSSRPSLPENEITGAANALELLASVAYPRQGVYEFAPWGHVEEWLRNGLQNRVHQFNSGRGLHPLDQIINPSKFSPPFSAWHTLWGYYVRVRRCPWPPRYH